MGSGGAGAFPAEVVLESDDVVEFRGRDFHHLDVLQGLEAMGAPGRDPAMIPGGHFVDLQLPGFVRQMQGHPPAHHEDRFVLRLVVLEREALAFFDEEELPDVAVRMGPDQLMAPGFFDATALGESDIGRRLAPHLSGGGPDG